MRLLAIILLATFASACAQQDNGFNEYADDVRGDQISAGEQYRLFIETMIGELQSSAVFLQRSLPSHVPADASQEYFLGIRDVCWEYARFDSWMDLLIGYQFREVMAFKEGSRLLALSRAIQNAGSASAGHEVFATIAHNCYTSDLSRIDMTPFTPDELAVLNQTFDILLTSAAANALAAGDFSIEAELDLEHQPTISGFVDYIYDEGIELYQDSGLGARYHLGDATVTGIDLKMEARFVDTCTHAGAIEPARHIVETFYPWITTHAPEVSAALMARFDLIEAEISTTHDSLREFCHRDRPLEGNRDEIKAWLTAHLDIDRTQELTDSGLLRELLNALP